MMIQKKNVPTLRFAEFSDEWKIEKLGTLIEIKSGASPSNYELKEEGKYPFLKVEDLNNCAKYQLQSREYADSNRNSITPFSIIFPKRGAAILNNKIRINSVTVLMDSNLMSITPKNSNLNYEFLYYTVVLTKLHKIADTSTIPQINNKHIEPYKISVPSTKEQKKIAAFLTAIDEKMEQLAKKKDLLQQYRKGVMQKIFNQAIRFKDDNGNDFADWEDLKLGNVTKLFSSRNRKLADAKVYSVTNSKGFVLQSNHFDREIAGSDLTNYKIIERNDFAYNPARINVGSIAHFQDEIGIISSLYVCFRTTEKLDDTFLLNFLDLDHTKYQISNLGEGGVRIYLWYDLFALIKIKLPSLPEQKKITAFLSAIDDKIYSVNQRLEKTKEYKKGLLQQMFV